MPKELNMQSLAAVQRELLADPATRAAYKALEPEFETARELIAARARAGMTQSDVAERMGTTQSVIARLEAGRSAPSLRSVQRYAEAVGARRGPHRGTAEGVGTPFKGPRGHLNQSPA